MSHKQDFVGIWFSWYRMKYSGTKSLVMTRNSESDVCLTQAFFVWFYSLTSMAGSKESTQNYKCLLPCSRGWDPSLLKGWRILIHAIVFTTKRCMRLQLQSTTCRQELFIWEANIPVIANAIPFALSWWIEIILVVPWHARQWSILIVELPKSRRSHCVHDQKVATTIIWSIWGGLLKLWI